MEIACRAFVFYQDKLLLCKQKVPQRDFWTLPGGSVDPGETLTSCTVREISEEIGITIEIDQMLFIRELILPHRHRIEFYFSIKEQINEDIFNSISPHNEVEELGFFSLSDLTTITVKPECIPSLIGEINDKTKVFPRYLGNVV